MGATALIKGTIKHALPWLVGGAAFGIGEQLVTGRPEASPLPPAPVPVPGATPGVVPPLPTLNRETGQREGGPSAGTPPTPPPPQSYNPGDPNLPQQQALPPGGIELSGMVPVYERLIDQLIKTQEKALDPGLYEERAETDRESYRQMAEISRAAALDKMREKTARDLELGTINAWRSVTEAQINRETALAVGMMSLSATLGMPNPNVLQQTVGIIGKGVSAYGDPRSQFNPSTR